MRKQTILGFLILLLLLVFYGAFLTHKINLVTADLGRHIRNGEFFFQNWHVVKTNFYSYTFPDFSTLNHHWGAGAFFYLIWKGFGFAGVEVFFIAVSLAAFAIFFKIAKDRAGLAIASLVAIPIIPLLAERTEIRPEALTYLFAGLFLLLLLKYQEDERKYKLLFLLPILEVLWVNVHIYFILGPVIIGVFLLESLFVGRERFWKLLLILFVTSLAAFINSFGLEGVIAPFNIFKNYGYDLVENKSVWFIEKLIPNPNYAFFKFVFAGLILSFVIAFFKRRRDVSFQ